MSEEKKDPRLIEAEIAHHEADAELARTKTQYERIGVARSQHSLDAEFAKDDEHNLYTFFGGVSEGSVALAMSSLSKMSRLKPNAPFEIVFNSPGGGVFAGLALYDYLQVLKDQGHRITTSTVGMAASMGGILLQAGHERVAGPNSFMLIHEVSSGAVGKTADMEESIKFTKRLQDRLVSILAERSTMTNDEIEERWRKSDWWLDADEMLRLGFIDRIR